ncbi:hypothetical protein AVEN_207767-1 [Araneus ventricosus]|uniref:Uncharacterized protein n=1 Tax=Araneus ventricosus TaxID=182803 RepID=A0A4Y2BZN4_ARAVE|nr:hypothetical protein AVEN_207767-1 [Araneus ventricosus]
MILNGKPNSKELREDVEKAGIETSEDKTTLARGGVRNEGSDSFQRRIYLLTVLMNMLRMAVMKRFHKFQSYFRPPDFLRVYLIVRLKLILQELWAADTLWNFHLSLTMLQLLW